MGRIVTVNARKGGGVSMDTVVGTVEVTPTRMYESGIYTILDAPTVYGISNGVAELDLVPSPSGDDPAWAYRVTIRDDITGRSITEYVAVPSGEEAIAYTALPRFSNGGGSGSGLVPLVTRGDLPDGADVFTYTTSAHVGAWRIIPGRVYHNLPAASTQHGTLEVIKAGSSNTLRVTYFNEIWFAERPTGNWGAWRQVVTTEGLNLTALKINRGTLPPGTDLNTLTSAGNDGIWVLQAGQAYPNAPKPSFSQNAVLEVVPAANARTIHRITEFNTEHFRIAPLGLFGNWRTSVTTETTAPIESRVTVLESITHGAPAIASKEAILMRADGSTDFEKNADVLDIPASMTKMLTMWLARQTITDARLDENVTLNESDTLTGSTPQLQAGDALTFRELIYMAALPSHNVASELLANRVGGELPGAGAPRDKFIAAMNATVQGWGWTGANFVSASGLGTANKATPRQMAQLLWRIHDEDTTLLGIMGELTHTVTITGANARTFNISHSIPVNGDPGFPEFVSGKTGTLTNIIGNVAMMVSTRGVKRVLVTMGALPVNDRYPDARRILNKLGLTDLNIPGSDTSGLGSHIRIGNTNGMVSLSFAAAKMPENANVPAAIPGGFLPSGFSYGMLTVREGNSIRVVEVSLTASGDLILNGNLAGDSLRGMVTWPAA